MTFTADQLQETAAISVQYIVDSVISNISQINYFYHCMTTKSKEYRSGGKRIQQPIVFAENESQGFINGTTDVVSINTNQQMIFAEYDWKFYNTNVNVNLKEFTETDQTPEAIASLMAIKQKTALSSSIRELSQALFGSGADDQGRSFNGLTDIFAPSGVEYGGLTNTDFPDPLTWTPEIDLTTRSPNYTNVTKMLATLKGRSKQYGGGINNSFRPNLMMSNELVYNKFLSTAQIQQRFQEVQKVKSGFEGLEVNGVFWEIDHYSQGSQNGIDADNFLYILSTESLRFYYKYGMDKKSPFDQMIQVPNQPVKSSQRYHSGNIGCSSRRVNGVFKGLLV